jgi:glycosyltransferase involved in cell wall biosynthesis
MLFSIITPIYKTPTYKIQRLYESLLNQTYYNWEWIVYDDSPTDYKESYNYIKNLAENDTKIKLYTEDINIGIIGEVKKKAFSLGNGDVLVEVDHDDELVDTCLENLSTAYSYSNEIGFVYGHACELFENSNDIIDYGDNWAFGYGSYKTTTYKNKNYKVAIVGNINPKTIRHITGIPNHVRSWRKDIYHQIGGHNKNLEVADDYELIIRTFLKTKMAKINCFTYIQYFEQDSSNTQFEKNSNIQDLVYQTAKFYNKKIHNKFLELNIDDYVFIDEYHYNNQVEKPEIESYANIIIPTNLLKNVLLDDINQPTIIKTLYFDEYDLYGYSRVYNIASTLNYKKTEHYYNIIKWLIKLTNCQSYLELGVEYGENISEVKDLVKVCVGVDINSFNNKSNIEFYQMTTDDFFTKNDKYFNIIFIDANHNFEQVRKDFDNSIRILNKYGIIILHDTDPITNELLQIDHCHDSYKIIDYISTKTTLNIITFPIQETGMTFVMRKGDRRIYNIKK